MRPFARLPLALLSLLLAFNAHADVITDPRGDFLPTFTGVHNAALDILSAEVIFNASSNIFTLHISADGPIAGQPGVAYVFGFDVGGALNSPFGVVGEPAVAFNSTATLRSDGTGTTSGQNIVTTIVGNDISAFIPAALLPTKGALAPSNYRWSLWSIDSTIAGMPRNADFAPDGNANLTVVPEPSDGATMLTGLALLGFVLRRRLKR
jgi:hypothetical protein